MIPDFEKINERMEQASLNEFMPGFNKEQEWLRLSSQLHPVKERKFTPMWSYAAAILLLLAGGSWLAIRLAGTHKPQIAAHKTINTPQNQIAVITPAKDVIPAPPVAKSDNPANETEPNNYKNTVAVKRHIPPHKTYKSFNKYPAKGFVCNNTPCPIQICINQTMHCPNIQPAAISSCSTLEPDQSGRLTYKAHDKIAKNCSLTVNEIKITSIATGETILLNASSTPSTAQDVFNYITGKEKGDILAGMFNSDCNHQTKKHDLRLNNSYGDLIIQ
jgi:hypothetical protein